MQLLRKSSDRTTDVGVCLETLTVSFGADPTKPATRNMITDCCTRLLRSPLGVGMGPGSIAFAQACEGLLAIRTREYAGNQPHTRLQGSPGILGFLGRVSPACTKHVAQKRRDFHRAFPMQWAQGSWLLFAPPISATNSRMCSWRATPGCTVPSVR